MTSTVITLSGDYDYDQYRTSDLTYTEIDASLASWVVSNSGTDLNLYPFLVTDSTSVTLTGGVIDGEVPLDIDWEDAYVNSAAVFARDSDDVTFRDWTISEAWDGLRVTGPEDATFSVENVWLTNIRDDGIENDDGLSGTLTNVLMDGVFVGISLYDSSTTDQTDQTVTLDNVLIRMETFEYKGEMTHQPFFKFDAQVSPKLEIYDSILAIEDVDHREFGRLQDAWDSVTDASNNYFLNLSDEPLPDDYPLPPAGFTILEGEEARNYWENARSDWLEEFRGIGEPDPVATDPVVSDPVVSDPIVTDPVVSDPTQPETEAPSDPDPLEPETGSDAPEDDTGSGGGKGTKGGGKLKKLLGEIEDGIRMIFGKGKNKHDETEEAKTATEEQALSSEPLLPTVEIEAVNEGEADDSEADDYSVWL